MLQRLLFVVGVTATLLFGSSTQALAASPNIYQSDSKQFLVPNIPNTAGVSVNNYGYMPSGDFEIVNIPASYGATLSDGQVDESKFASLIIFKVGNNATISGTLKLMGQAADLLIITDNKDGSLTCDNCGFEGFGRVTLAAASSTSTISETTALVGELSAKLEANSSSGQLFVNNMNAPGVASLELIAGKILTQQNGLISTHLKGETHPDGGYVITDNGNLTIGAGGVNIFSGALAVDYESLIVENAVNSDDSAYLELKGRITANSVFVATPARSFIGDIDTRTDLVSTFNYKNTLSVPMEGINLRGYTQHSSMDINGDLLSDRDITLRNNGSSFYLYGSVIGEQVKVYAGLRLFPSSHLSASIYEQDGWLDINASAKADLGIARIKSGFFNNYGSMFADDLELSIDEFGFENYGVFNVNTAVISPKTHFYNKFGGRVYANTLTVDVPNGVFRNGSREPSTASVNDKTELNLPATTAHISQSNPGQLGTHYDLGDSSGNKVNDLSAHISATQLNVKTKFFENINPYYVYKKTANAWDSGIPLDTRFSNQVSISAENSLQIDASSYVLNSSAIMLLSNVGEFKVKTTNFLNDRYRIESLVDVVSATENSGSGASSSSTTTKSLVTDLYYYSPPGRVVSLGNFRVQASIGFTNNVSFFETYGDAHFLTSNAQSIGIEMGTNVYEKYKITETIDTYCGKDDSRHVKVERPEMCEVVTVETIVETVSPDERETLFYVHGNFYGSAARFVSENFDPLAYYSQLALDDYKEKNNWYAYSEVSEETVRYYQERECDYYDEDWDYDTVRHIDLGRYKDSEKPEDYDGKKNCTQVKTEKNIIEIVIDYVTALKNQILALINTEVDWWN